MSNTLLRFSLAFLLCLVLSSFVYLRGLVYVGVIGFGAAFERGEWVHQDGTRIPVVEEPELSVKIAEPNRLLLTHRVAYLGYGLCLVGFVESILGLLLFFLKRGNKFFLYLFSITAGLALIVEIADAVVVLSFHPLKIAAHVSGFFAILILVGYSKVFYKNMKMAHL